MRLAPPELAKACGATLPRATNWCDSLNAAMALFEIGTAARVAAFLAQVSHESGRLVYVRELWGPDQVPAQREYERDPASPWSARDAAGKRHRNSKAFELGNSEPGDGFRYRGRGLIQVTGRGNYAHCRDGLRNLLPTVPDFVSQPELLEAPRWAAMSAAEFWQRNGLNQLADDTEANFLTITRRINGGINGLSDRVALWDGARAALA